ncbi:hypothetical protein ENUP19_0370G0030 [Entamoeba nuttalli]|uniref:tRNA (Cytosine-5-)-methyltransferase, putative n=2 Tax=Entamoeba nuttalli TaxID=412467 RepID=K2HCL3_ENTNP|nr:tRNA (cytosine-5-)-methyltransferase, putative [Entamoeba nuttalli P19]EKE40489.1 tRNA (cytosine-5-)-methyltransferase, putative [Entamoeba nuttalli P19]|eukprot:XP_008857177.1 tRNA (cytosine-5-)-methyltransferase, putative [Entamoeba nuttalli P19]
MEGEKKEEIQQEEIKKDDGRKPSKKDYHYITENPEMEKFYSQQTSIMNNEEFKEYIETMHKTLPTTFRLTRNEQTPIIKEELKRLINNIENEQERPIELSWYPGGIAYQLNASRGEIQKNKSLEELRRFIIVQTEAGVISRQEAVSMIPPLFLNVKPYHDVLDLCAAPGSKTTQILEMIHSGPEEATGIVIANDSDYKRCELLDHQTKRLQSPNIIITNHLAQNYPVKIGDQFMKFDRVLCDVPCSGDGTLRKNPDAWGKWNIMRGINLHKTQCTIMRRAVRLVKSCGRFVYSTCSLNPYEDEAVVAFILRNYPQIRLVDVSTELPTLKRCKGVSSWKVFNKEGEELTIKPDSNEDGSSKIPSTLFPPTEEEAKKFRLDRCMRFLPQLQNTGGFFVAVLEKVGDLDNDFKEEKQKRKKAPKPIKTRKGDSRLMPLNMTEGYETITQTIKNFYGLEGSGFDFECLGFKGDGKGTLHYLIKKAMDLVRINELKIVGGGLKLFRKHSVGPNSSFRLSNEGLSAVAHLFGERRKLEIKHEEFVKMLISESPVQLGNEVMERAKDMEVGCVIFQIKDANSPINKQYFSGWKSKGLSLFVSKVDKKALCQNLKIELPKNELHEDSDSEKKEKKDEN